MKKPSWTTSHQKKPQRYLGADSSQDIFLLELRISSKHVNHHGSTLKQKTNKNVVSKERARARTRNTNIVVDAAG